MQIVDRDYQVEAVNSVPAYFARKAGNPLIAMPTGTGKSVVIARLLQYIFRFPGQRVLVVTHVKELIEQNHEKLMRVWPQAPAGIFSAGLKRKDKFNPIIFCGIQTVAKKAIEFGRVDIMIIDEAHLVSPKQETSYLKFIKDLLKINPMMKVIGLTATKWRTGHGLLTEEGGLFTDICFDITGMEAFNRLISEGYLSPLIPKPTHTQFDISDVHVQAGEYNQKELQIAVDKAEITRAALQEAIFYGQQQNRNSWIIFAAGVEHAIHCCDMLNELGVSCTVVHSDMSDTERDKNIADWMAGKYTCISNNGILTTGIDHPMLDYIIMLRHTMSSGLWVQMLGRGTRPVYAPGYDLTTREGRLAAIAAGPKQNCLVLDFANNVKRLGPINDPVIPGKKGKKGGTAPVKLCEFCNTWNHATLRHCFFCGTEFSFKVNLKVTAATTELIKTDEPVVEVFKVDHVTYSRHDKVGGSSSVKVNYYCGLRAFKEFVPLQYSGSAHGIAKRWWNERLKQGRIPPDRLPMPNTVDEALIVINQLPVATHIRVWINKPYPEILAYCYDGTKFGTEAKTQAPPMVQVDAGMTRFKDPGDEARTQAASEQSLARLNNKIKAQTFDDMDDDIPF